MIDIPHDLYLDIRAFHIFGVMVISPSDDRCNHDYHRVLEYVGDLGGHACLYDCLCRCAILALLLIHVFVYPSLTLSVVIYECLSSITIS